MKSNAARNCSNSQVLIPLILFSSGFSHTQCLGTHETQMLQSTLIVLTMLSVPLSLKPFATLFLHFQGRNLYFWLSEFLSSGVLSFTCHCCGLVTSLPTCPEGAVSQFIPKWTNTLQNCHIFSMQVILYKSSNSALIFLLLIYLKSTWKLSLVCSVFPSLDLV